MNRENESEIWACAETATDSMLCKEGSLQMENNLRG